MPDCPETQYCLGIQVISTEDGGATPPSHAWQVPVVEDMVCDGKSGLTKAIVMGPGQAVLFYGRWSLGEGLSLGEECHVYTIRAQLNTNPLSLWEGQQLIAKAITEQHIEARQPGCPHSHLLVTPPFMVHSRDKSP